MAFRLLWHHGRTFQLKLDTRRRTLRFPVILPEVPVKSEMYDELKRFVESRASAKLPPHRRIDPKKARMVVANRGGNVSLTLTLAGKGADYEYGTRKLIHLVHEIFLVFLAGYYEYQVEVFDLNPDNPSAV